MNAEPFPDCVSDGPLASRMDHQADGSIGNVGIRNLISGQQSIGLRRFWGVQEKEFFSASGETHPLYRFYLIDMD